MRPYRTVPAIALALMTCVPAARAQQADPRLSQEPQPAGWSVTPSVTTSTAYDDNVLMQGDVTAPPSDLNTAVNPAGTLDYSGKRGTFSASYSGSFQLYRDFGTLNSYDQFLNVGGRRRVNSHLVLFAKESYSDTATTDVPALAGALTGVRFVRIGARVSDFRAGVEALATKRLSLAASYNFDWIAFDKDPLEGVPLFGGRSNGASAGLKYQLGLRTMLTADYDMQRASIVDGTQFAIQNAWSGIEYRLSETSQVSAAIGLARMDAPEFGTGKTSPAWRAAYGRHFEAAVVDVSYARSFIPSFGRGGTLSNDELTSKVHVPVGRRLYADGAVSWLRNRQVVVTDDLPLTTVWISGVVGYAVQPWIRLEGFYGSSRQNVDRPGGRMSRNRVGIQVVTAKPVRIR